MARQSEKTPFDAVDTVLLGLTPADVPAAAAPGGTGADPRAARLADVRRYLEAQPQVRAEFGREIAEAWRASGEERGPFLRAVSESRARLLSQASISQVRPQAPQAAATFQRELTRYLLEREGAGADDVV
jgi:hypothetical protein